MLGFKPLGRESLSELTYTRLRAAIVTGDLAPGARFKDVEVAAELGVSRTPVREALKRLADQGLVETVPGALTRVAPLSAESIADVFPVVATLHALAARLAGQRLAGDALEEMRDAQGRLSAAVARDDLAAAIEADEAFHAVALHAAGNDELASAIAMHSATAARAEHACLDSAAASELAARHDAILDLLADRRVDRAATLVERDWLALGRALEQSLAARPADVA